MFYSFTVCLLQIKIKYRQPKHMMNCRLILAKCLLAGDLHIYTPSLGICQHIKSRIKKTNHAVLGEKKVWLAARWQETRSWHVLWQCMESEIYIFSLHHLFRNLAKVLMLQNRPNLRSHQKTCSVYDLIKFSKREINFFGRGKKKNHLSLDDISRENHHFSESLWKVESHFYCLCFKRQVRGECRRQVPGAANELFANTSATSNSCGCSKKKKKAQIARL